MNQPTFTEGPPVPMMVEGLIDSNLLRRLFVDLQTAATISEVREKNGPLTHSAESAKGVTEVFDRLLAGTARAIQVRYRFDGSDWTDTVFATSTGFRVNRCRHDPS